MPEAKGRREANPTKPRPRMKDDADGAVAEDVQEHSGAGDCHVEKISGG